jgi:hypothetical protein
VAGVWWVAAARRRLPRLPSSSPPTWPRCRC